MKIGSNNNALIFYRRHFPPGTLGFKVPCASAIKPNPCPNYKAIEGRTFYLVRWELNIPDIELRCHVVKSNIYNQCEGTLIHQSTYDYRENHAATIVLDLEGNTNYAISMRYQCNCCGIRFKGNEGDLFGHIPYHIRKGYDVDPKMATGNTKKHLTTAASRQMERLMVKDGSGDLISHIMHEMRGAKYEDVNHAFFYK